MIKVIGTQRTCQLMIIAVEENQQAGIKGQGDTGCVGEVGGAMKATEVLSENEYQRDCRSQSLLRS